MRNNKKSIRETLDNKVKSLYEKIKSYEMEEGFDSPEIEIERDGHDYDKYEFSRKVRPYEFMKDLEMDSLTPDEFKYQMDTRDIDLEDELYGGNHGPIMDQKIEDLLSQIEAIIGYSDAEEYESEEDYMEDMPKPGIGQKLKQSLRDLSGIGNKNDNTTLKQIHALIAKGMIDNVRRQPNGITAWVNNEALILDIEMPEIIYAGRNLEVTNLESKVLDLYSELLDFI